MPHCFSPTLETWLLAISRGHFITWPGLTTANVRRYLPKSEATAKDTSTNNAKTCAQQKPSPFKRGGSRLPPNAGNRANKLCLRSCSRLRNGKHLIHSDLTGRFPIQSSRGMNYVLVVYDYDSNAILAEPMRNRTDAEMLRAYGVILNRLIVSRAQAKTPTT
jgi:hypothetical protein